MVGGSAGNTRSCELTSATSLVLEPSCNKQHRERGEGGGRCDVAKSNCQYNRRSLAAWRGAVHGRALVADNATNY